MMTPKELFYELNHCFSYFDCIVDKYNLEKLKTIGDCYMCAGGIPVATNTHAIDAVLAAFEMQTFTQMRQLHKKREGKAYWGLRVGIHSGPLLAGVVGRKKFAYDVWGDTVNTAAQIESLGVSNRVNISDTTYHLIQDLFNCTYRGSISVKDAHETDVYVVDSIKGGLSLDPVGTIPNQNFIRHYLDKLPHLAIAPTFCNWAIATTIDSKPAAFAP